MIDKSESRKGYIGGSDMNYVYGSYETKTFKQWWGYKMTGVKPFTLHGKSIFIGNILEHYILDAMNVPKKSRGIKMLKEGTIAGVNTDALMYENGGELDKFKVIKPVVYEAKTMKMEKVLPILHGNKLPIGYRRQVYHAMWVCDAEKSVIGICGVKDSEYGNPFAINVDERLVKLDYFIKDFDVKEHEIRINYLTDCMNNNMTPTNEGLNIHRLHENRP